MRHWIGWGAAACTLGLLTAPAFAVTYKNPAHDVQTGQVVFGAQYEEYERTLDIEGAGERDYDISVLGLSVGFGVARGGLLTLTAGPSAITSGSLDDELVGFEGALSYRHNLDQATPLDEGADPFHQFRKGLLASVRIGNAEDSDGNGIDYYQYDLGFGVGTNVIRQVQAYGGAVLSFVEGTGYSEMGPDAAVESVDPLGLFAGIQWQPQSTLLVGVEVHAIHEFGIGLYVEFLP